MADQYCIKWDGFNCHLGEVFRNLWSSGQHVDVTLNAQGLSFKCHKIILCAASPYFEVSILLLLAYESSSMSSNSQPIKIMSAVLNSYMDILKYSFYFSFQYR